MEAFKIFSKASLLIVGLGLANAGAHTTMSTLPESVPVIADLHLLKQVGAQITSQDQQINLGYAFVDQAKQNQLSLLAHKAGKCGGFEVVQNAADARNINFSLQFLKQRLVKDHQYSRAPVRLLEVPKRAEITQAIALADEKNLMAMVNWLSAFPNRYNKAPEPNAHVVQLKVQIEKMINAAKRFGRNGMVELIDHKSTKQKTIHVVLPGATKPLESVILGGHLDSISFGGNAPGADDNASGSANVLEALRVLLSQPQTARTLEFFWYAGEESGLLGSAEIAAAYKANKRNVIGVLQLDMTLYPGEGEFVIGNITDFTSSWLRQLLADINRNYLNAKMVDDKCGYGCSDHASWYRQGYPTAIPFEATMNTMNQNIHTSRDVVSPAMSFKHSLVFTKLAIAYAMELGNNIVLQQPY